ncbi:MULTISPECIES: hypothetical protein [Cupriavidus]|uniref:hypothetical protein n=1 Tax=Cupriavidus TaxID=106589 RepID=UPI000B2A72C3|nr:hypothetical protein [Cupriavidus basilensis]
MLVRATAQGYAGKDGHQLREPGDVFEVEDGAKATWFVPVEKDEKQQATRRGKAEDLA